MKTIASLAAFLILALAYPAASFAAEPDPDGWLWVAQRTTAKRASTAVVGCAADSHPAAEHDPAAIALHFALTKNAEHAGEWLAAGDFRSLGLAASEAGVLGELLKHRSDDPAWQRAAADVLAAAAGLRAAAEAGSRERSQASLQKLSSAVNKAGSLQPAGKPLAGPLPAPGVRPLMRMVDGAYADGKVALLTGNVAEAKTAARALAELALVVSNARTTDGWAEMAGDLRAASLAAADSPASDKQTVRQLLRGISERCDACHNAQ